MDPLPLPLRTDRLRLRTYVESDAEALLPIYSRDDVSRFLLSDPWDVEEARSQIAKRLPRTGLETETRALALVIEVVEPSGSGTVIGDIALWHDTDDSRKAEIGWVLDPAAGGRGYATEAAAEVLRIAFDHYGLHRVVAQLDARNTASARLAERVGMHQEAHLRQDWWSKGEWTDTLVYARLGTD